MKIPGFAVHAVAALLLSCFCTAATAQAADEIEPVSGISTDALAAIMGIPDGGTEKLYGIFYFPDKIDPMQLAAAPERICKSRGLSLASAEDQPLEHESEMPGVRKFMVRCK